MDDRLRFKDCARLLKALADPHRLQLIERLRTGGKNVSELASLLGVEPTNVSNHMRVLRNAGLVSYEKQGAFVVYSLNTTFFRPKGPGNTADSLDLGCYRVELTGP